MIAMAEYYIVINKCEIGEECAKLIHIFRQTGSVDEIGADAYRIRNASELDQQSTFAAFERAIYADFPNQEDDTEDLSHGAALGALPSNAKVCGPAQETHHGK